jgi:DNA-binding protein H-NS
MPLPRGWPPKVLQQMALSNSCETTLRLDFLRKTTLEFWMAKTVDQIREQIAKLQAQEQALLQKEALGVIAQIKVAVQHYGITPEQIFGTNGIAKKTVAKKTATPRKAAAKAPKKAGRAKSPKAKPAKAESAAKSKKAASVAKGTKIAAKYKDDAGNAWSGRGSQPRWLRAAIEGGKKLEDFAVA